MITEKIADMGVEHTQWLSALDFYKQELGTLRERLTEIAGKYTTKEVAAEVEHFENQFTIQAEHIDILRHDINKNLEKAAIEAKDNTAGYIDAALIATHSRQKEAFASLEHVISELRKDFNRFAEQWM